MMHFKYVLSETIPPLGSTGYNKNITIRFAWLVLISVLPVFKGTCCVLVIYSIT